MTPYTPTAPSTTPTPAKTSSSDMMRRGRATDADITCSSDLTSEIGTSASAARTVSRASPATANGSPRVRTASVIAPAVVCDIAR